MPAKTTPLRINDDVMERARPLISLLKISESEFVKRCVAEMVDLTSTSADRRVIPDIVVQVDALRSRRQGLGADPISMRLNEDPPVPAAKRRA